MLSYGECITLIDKRARDHNIQTYPYPIPYGIGIMKGEHANSSTRIVCVYKDGKKKIETWQLTDHYNDGRDRKTKMLFLHPITLSVGLSEKVCGIVNLTEEEKTFVMNEITRLDAAWYEAE